MTRTRADVSNVRGVVRQESETPRFQASLVGYRIQTQWEGRES
jgi:hypothetical protein